MSNLKFVYDQMNKTLPGVFEKKLIKKFRKHLYNTRGNSIDVPQVKTMMFQLIHITFNLYMEFL